jgi:ATP-dependent Lhr-like helicase
MLRELGTRDLIVQTDGGLLLHGELGEKLANHYEFYSAFVTEDEFRVVVDGKALGTLPVSRPLLPESRVIFAGRRWRVLDVDTGRKVITVTPDPGGAPPMFDAGGAMVHDKVRMEMRAVLADTAPVPFLDASGQRLLDEARRYYREAGLATRRWVTDGRETVLLTWTGDWVNDALVLLLGLRGFRCTNEGIGVSVSAEPSRVLDALDEIQQADETDAEALLVNAKNLFREKWDWALPPALLRKSYASSWLDLTGAFGVASKLTQPG